MLELRELSRDRIPGIQNMQGRVALQGVEPGHQGLAKEKRL
jgi:hypothetical protein